MRKQVSKAVRIEPGDEIVVQARLASNSQIGRLFVFAREGGGPFSLYVHNLAAMVSGDRPQLMQPMSMRLSSNAPAKHISFVADIDGYICVMQEIDNRKDVCAKVAIKRRICPDLPWKSRIIRRLGGIFADLKVLSWSN